HFRLPFLEELATIARRRRLEASEAISLVIAAAGVFDRLLPALLDAHAAAGGAPHGGPQALAADPPVTPPLRGS
ncbi:MAG TPA: hypothetical protein VFP19_04145, partial [Candidatus Limnocylindrales bacterium]|nr:hypothetical protein [Candidatus Limnocylindrales bacterium]